MVAEAKKNSDVREGLALASLLAGLSISQTRTSICHSISYPLTLKYGIDHGLACSFSMLEVYKFNKESIDKDIKIIEKEISCDPYTAIEDIFYNLEPREILAKSLPAKLKFTESIEDFITEGRFENNIRKCESDDLIHIITASYDLLFE